jgi:hypothetical protein
MSDSSNQKRPQPYNHVSMASPLWVIVNTRVRQYFNAFDMGWYENIAHASLFRSHEPEILLQSLRKVYMGAAAILQDEEAKDSDIVISKLVYELKIKV